MVHMKESLIEKELVTATKIKPKKAEVRQIYLKRLLKAIYNLSDDVWSDLTEDTQEWYNEAAKQSKEGHEIPDFPDLPQIPVEIDNKHLEEPEEAKAEDTPIEEEAKPAAKPKARKMSACHAIKTLVVKKPSITVDELSNKLKDKGLKVSDVTIATLRSDTRDTLRVLNETGIGEFKL